ncbi:MAG: sulfurase [Pelagibacteraceae bacterium]|nr:sulfurase [Pelagibacteraceae bacterium]|tara:strand:+ start:918 stop:1367 length:450 start_codon:yes stop_codon:yes gene_type:complete
MAVIDKINISEKSDGDTYYKTSIYLEKNKGIQGDRYYNNFKEKKNQVTIIENEKIENFNNKLNKKIQPKDFRRNLITIGIDLNSLIGKKIKIGTDVILYIHEICQPCNYLQKKLKVKELVKLLVNKSGVNAEIVNSGIIKQGDEIFILD